MLGLTEQKTSKDGSYLESAPAYMAMRVGAGFEKNRESVFYPRALVTPSEELQKLVFPFLEERVRQYESSDKDDQGFNFLTMMQILRVNLLQDFPIVCTATGSGCYCRFSAPRRRLFIQAKLYLQGEPIYI
jgi:hypothetical protein